MYLLGGSYRFIKMAGWAYALNSIFGLLSFSTEDPPIYFFFIFLFLLSWQMEHTPFPRWRILGNPHRYSRYICLIVCSWSVIYSFLMHHRTETRPDIRTAIQSNLLCHHYIHGHMIRAVQHRPCLPAGAGYGRTTRADCVSA